MAQQLFRLLIHKFCQSGTACCKFRSIIRSNIISDSGVAALVAHEAGAWPSLQELWLDRNHIGDAGRASLAGALRTGAMPALRELKIEKNAAGERAVGTKWPVRPNLLVVS